MYLMGKMKLIKMSRFIEYFSEEVNWTILLDPFLDQEDQVTVDQVN